MKNKFILIISVTFLLGFISCAVNNTKHKVLEQNASEVKQVLIGDYGCNYHIYSYKDSLARIDRSIIKFQNNQTLVIEYKYSDNNKLISEKYHIGNDSIYVTYDLYSPTLNQNIENYFYTVKEKSNTFIDTFSRDSSYSYQKLKLQEHKRQLDKAIIKLIKNEKSSSLNKLPLLTCGAKAENIIDQVYEEKIFNLNPSSISIGNGRRATGIYYIYEFDKKDKPKANKVYYHIDDQNYLIENIKYK